MKGKHWVEKIFEERGAILDGHVVLASGRHSARYLDKAMVYVDAGETSDLCFHLASEARSRRDDIQAVIGPATGGIVLSQWTAYHLSDLYQRVVLSLFTEKESGRQVLRSQYQKLVAGKNILVVDDTLTTGDSVRQVIEAVEKAGGKVVAVAIICNRGRITSEELGYLLFWLWKADIKSWLAEQCPLCQQGIPIDKLK